MPTKLVVTATPKGSRIALLGSSGKVLLTSAVFAEPRAKGATLRALRGILGEDVTVEDSTTTRGVRSVAGVESAPVPSSPPAAKKKATPRKKAGRARSTVRAVRASSPNGSSSMSVKPTATKRAARKTAKR